MGLKKLIAIGAAAVVAKETVTSVGKVANSISEKHKYKEDQKKLINETYFPYSVELKRTNLLNPLFKTYSIDAGIGFNIEIHSGKAEVYSIDKSYCAKLKVKDGAILIDKEPCVVDKSMSPTIVRTPYNWTWQYYLDTPYGIYSSAGLIARITRLHDDKQPYKIEYFTIQNLFYLAITVAAIELDMTKG